MAKRVLCISVRIAMNYPIYTFLGLHKMYIRNLYYNYIFIANLNSISYNCKELCERDNPIKSFIGTQDFFLV